MKSKENLIVKYRFLILSLFLLAMGVISFFKSGLSISEYWGEITFREISFVLLYLIGTLLGVAGLVKSLMNKDNKIVGLFGEGSSPGTGMLLMILGIGCLLAMEFLKVS